MPITPTVSPGLRLRLLETVEHDRRGLDQHAGIERDVVGQPVDDARGHRDEFGVSARSSEPERLDPLAPVRLASAARARSGGSRSSLRRRRGRPARTDVDIGPDLDHRPRPLVSGDHREANPTRVGEDPVITSMSVRHSPASRLRDEHVVGTDGGRVDLSVGDLVWSLDDDRLHRGRILCAMSATGDLAGRFSALYTGALTDVLDRQGYGQQTLPPELSRCAGHAAGRAGHIRCWDVRTPGTTTTPRSGRSWRCSGR